MLLQKKKHQFFLVMMSLELTAGKKETVTRNCEKVQKRYLLDKMRKLYRDFKEEHRVTTCSILLFYKEPLRFFRKVTLEYPKWLLLLMYCVFFIFFITNYRLCLFNYVSSIRYTNIFIVCLKRYPNLSLELLIVPKINITFPIIIC